MSRRGSSDTEIPTLLFSRNSRRTSSETEASLLGKISSIETEKPPSLTRDTSRRGTTPIIFSQSAARRKPPPVEMKLECTLEELCEGCLKKIKITRDAITNTGFVRSFPILILSPFVLFSFFLLFSHTRNMNTSFPSKPHFLGS